MENPIPDTLGKLLYTLRDYGMEDLENLLTWFDETPHCGLDVYTALAEVYRKKYPLAAYAFFGPDLEDKDVNQSFSSDSLDSLHAKIHYCTDIEAINKTRCGRSFTITLEHGSSLHVEDLAENVTCLTCLKGLYADKHAEDTVISIPDYEKGKVEKAQLRLKNS